MLSTQREQPASCSSLSGEVAGKTKPDLSESSSTSWKVVLALPHAAAAVPHVLWTPLMSQGKSLSQHRANRRNPGLYYGIFQMTQLTEDWGKLSSNQGRWFPYCLINIRSKDNFSEESICSPLQMRFMGLRPLNTRTQRYTPIIPLHSMETSSVIQLATVGV